MEMDQKDKIEEKKKKVFMVFRPFGFSFGNAL